MSNSDVDNIIIHLKKWAIDVNSKLKADKICVFGSLIYRKGEQFTALSDIDIVIVMPNGDALFRTK